MPVVAMTREMGSLGSSIAQEVARRLGYQFLRNDILRSAVRGVPGPRVPPRGSGGRGAGPAGAPAPAAVPVPGRACLRAGRRAGPPRVERYGLDRDEAARQTAAYDEGVRARMRQMFDVDWTDPLLYDLVINTGAVSVTTAAGQVLASVELDIQAVGGLVRLAGVVGSEVTRDAALAVVREVAGVAQVSSEAKVFRRPVR